MTKSNFNTRLNWVLEDIKLTPQEFASKIGLSNLEVKKLCSGQKHPSFLILEQIANAFPDLDCRWLLTGTGATWVSMENIDERMLKLIEKEIKLDFLEKKK